MPLSWSAIAPGWLPWFADIDRQMYFFYAATMAPFLVMAIALICGDILNNPAQNAERRTLGLIAVCCYVALVVTNFAWLFPVLTGCPSHRPPGTWRSGCPAGGRASSLAVAPSSASRLLITVFGPYPQPWCRSRP